MNFVLKIGTENPEKVTATNVWAAVNRTINSIDPEASMTAWEKTYDSETSKANVTFRVRQNLKRTRYKTAKALKKATAAKMRTAVKSGKMTELLDEECDCEADVEEMEEDSLNRNYPTLLPTALPTPEPTPEPTPKPTWEPSHSPSESPTAAICTAGSQRVA